MFAFDSRRTSSRVIGGSLLASVFLLLIGCGGSSSGSSAPASVTNTGTPGAEQAVGERLFVETRFAQFFKAYLDSGGKVNDVLPIGDPVMDISETTGPGVGLPGPFAGLSMNCRACPPGRRACQHTGRRDADLCGLCASKSDSGPWRRQENRTSELSAAGECLTR
jgi:hypothetical protein